MVKARLRFGIFRSRFRLGGLFSRRDYFSEVLLFGSASSMEVLFSGSERLFFGSASFMRDYFWECFFN